MVEPRESIAIELPAESTNELVSQRSQEVMRSCHEKGGIICIPKGRAGRGKPPIHMFPVRELANCLKSPYLGSLCFVKKECVNTQEAFFIVLILLIL